MRFTTFIAAAAVAGHASAAASICDKYTTALLTNNTAANQYAVLSLLIKTVVLGNFTGPGSANPTLPGSLVAVPGILAPSMVNGIPVNLLPYFDGTFLSTNQGGSHGVSQNFLDGGSPSNPLDFGTTGSSQYILLSHLAQFFGVLLGCSEYGTMGFPKYGGVVSQYSVHKYMDLAESDFTYFIEQVGLAAQSFGVSMADITTVAGSLNTTFGYRCSPPVVIIPGTEAEEQVICDDPTCPVSPNATCVGNAAEGMFTPTAAGSISAPYMTAASTAMPMASGTGAMTSLMPYSANAAPAQTAAAGIMAVVGIAAVLL